MLLAACLSSAQRTGIITVQAPQVTTRELFLAAGSVVAHCFMEDARQTYDLEGLWAHDDGSNMVHIQGPQTLDTLHAI